MLYQICITVAVCLAGIAIVLINKELEEHRQLIGFLIFSLQSQEKDDSIISEPLAKDLERLSEIKKLKENWDEEGAAPFSDKFIQRLLGVLYTLSDDPPTMISPTSQKSVIFEYIDDISGRLAIEFYEDNEPTQTLWLCGKEKKSKEIKEDLEIFEVLQEYRERGLSDEK